MILNLSKYNNLTQRVLVALTGVVLIIISIILGEWTYFAIFFLICLFTLLEFYKLAGLDGMIPLKFWGTFNGLCIFTLTFLVESQLLSETWYFLIFPFVTMIFFVKLYKKEEDKPFTNIAFTFLGIIYVAGPFALINVSIFIFGHYNYAIILGYLFLLWASDTGAYFAGKTFGKTKLFERVSPKKSWEGSLGGTALAFLIAYLFSIFFNEIPQWQWFSIAAIIVITGTYGDLVESLLKRSMMIKDSSHSIPGHGGFLDRFDGLLLSSPFVAAFFKISNLFV